MDRQSRRQFLRAAGGVGLGAAGLATLAACADEEEGPSEPSGPVQWWESGKPQTALDEKLVKQHADRLGEVDVTFQENTKFGQALQLAHQSDQMPDLTVVNATALGASLGQLIAGGWFQPLALDDGAMKRVEAMDLMNGRQIFDGKIYSFPVTQPAHNVINWFHKPVMEEAGLDPESPPTTYDEFRQACAQVKKAGTTGFLLPMAVVPRNASQASTYAQAAGFAGMDGRLFRTGEYVWHSDEFVNYFEFLKSLFDDGHIVKGGTTQNVKAAQAQWASGASAFYWDGPWIPGNIALDYPKLKGKVGSGPLLVPESGMQPMNYVLPPGNSYFIPKGAKQPDKANMIMSLLTTEDYQIGYAEIMGHPPYDTDAIEKSAAEPIWKDTVMAVLKQQYLAPDPLAGNDGVATVESQLKPVKPDPGALIQGYFSGDVSNLPAALKKASGDMNKALEMAIAAAKKKGADVSLDAYAFDNWQPGQDYTAEMYAS